ncbi:MAG: flagellar biosynthetic protein FliP, partial [Roseovarius sp.]
MRRCFEIPQFTFLLVGVLLIIFAKGAAAQDISMPLFDEQSLSQRSIQLIALITILSLAPGIAIMVTCFPFIVTVLSILRQALGLQQSPPNMLIVSLALFLTYYIMDPVFNAAWESGIEPLLSETINIEVAFTRTIEPFRHFMYA